ncbi:MAG: hypothetical protein KKC76_06305 [Proteobacteria bacterium]|nr:hypothetical protein [Pseudomonadota bacterium]MBU4297633.1 hypothetical protein [Pseudomonadota bacterium]MCG2750004.1 hypothetical protein [Desulfobulbaceae bacterium]
MTLVYGATGFFYEAFSCTPLFPIIIVAPVCDALWQAAVAAGYFLSFFSFCSVYFLFVAVIMGHKKTAAAVPAEAGENLLRR